MINSDDETGGATGQAQRGWRGKTVVSKPTTVIAEPEAEALVNGGFVKPNTVKC